MTVAKFSGKEFKRLISAVSKYPSIGNFAGADLINLEVVDGRATATTFGVVLSRARVPAEGELALVGLERRTVEAFAGICPDSAKLTISRNGTKEVLIKFKGREISPPVLDGQRHKIPAIKGVGGIKITTKLAERLAYLSSMAYNDSSKPELCCVLLSAAGRAMAANQRAVGCMRSPRLPGSVAAPLPLARALGAGDVLFAGTKETLVKSGCAVYSMPSPTRAQKDFPVEMILGFGKVAKTPLASCSGPKFVSAVTECASCLGQLARTEVAADIQLANGKMTITASNGGAKFQAALPVQCEQEATVKVPLESLVQVMPFVTEKVNLAVNKTGDVFLDLDVGWAMFPCWKAK